MNWTIGEFEHVFSQELTGKKMPELLKLLLDDETQVDVELKSPKGRSAKDTASLDSWKRKDGQLVLRFRRPRRSGGKLRNKVTEVNGNLIPGTAQNASAVMPPGQAAQEKSLDDQIIEALDLLHQRQKRSFYGLGYFKRQLPSLGIDLPELELKAILDQMITQGKLILEPLPVPKSWHNASERPPTITVRTSSMPPPTNWYKSGYERLNGQRDSS